MSHYKHIKEGDEVDSPFFGQKIKVIKINSNEDWYFEIQGHIMKAKTPLSHFERKLNKTG